MMAVTRAGCAWSTACCSPCRARRRSTTARRSAWARTSRPRAGWRCGPRCSGSHCATAGSPPPPHGGWCSGQCRTASAPSTSTSLTRKRDPDSLWNFMRHLIQTYRECPELGWGDFLGAAAAAPAGVRAPVPLGRSSIVAVHNLGADPARSRSRSTLGHRGRRPGLARGPARPGRSSRDAAAPSSCRWTATGTAGSGCVATTSRVPEQIGRMPRGRGCGAVGTGRLRWAPCV